MKAYRATSKNNEFGFQINDIKLLEKIDSMC